MYVWMCEVGGKRLRKRISRVSRVRGKRKKEKEFVFLPRVVVNPELSHWTIPEDEDEDENVLDEGLLGDDEAGASE
ncbi:hypothetical protein KQX54_009031 [Cotesia glomerata]|uniref:Uncharacterized protein n=1 Tax=Cotesia glomerata TaxID=32391 RepID=A0AAV7J0I8_COTGL|nr:hypothetical protein KQX54_009031 [Cotesia glomerata]